MLDQTYKRKNREKNPKYRNVIKVALPSFLMSWSFNLRTRRLAVAATLNHRKNSRTRPTQPHQAGQRNNRTKGDTAGQKGEQQKNGDRAAPTDTHPRWLSTGSRLRRRRLLSLQIGRVEALGFITRPVRTNANQNIEFVCRTNFTNTSVIKLKLLKKPINYINHTTCPHDLKIKQHKKNNTHQN